MLINLKEILKIAEDRNCAIPAFNVYNIETLIGVMEAADELKSPVIFQIYSRLFDEKSARILAPAVVEVARMMSVPAVFHIDHGSGIPQIMRAVRYGATGIMIDASLEPLDVNTQLTRHVVELCAAINLYVEGELGHIGATGDTEMGEYTDPDEASRFVEETGIAALAVMVGTAHGRYKQDPKLDIERIAEIKDKTGVPLVLHGGSGVPDNQISAAINAGIRKVNFGTDICYSFLDGIFDTPRETVAIDMFMKEPVKRVKAFAMKKIKLLGAG